MCYVLLPSTVYRGSSTPSVLRAHGKRSMQLYGWLQSKTVSVGLATEDFWRCQEEESNSTAASARAGSLHRWHGEEAPERLERLRVVLRRLGDQADNVLHAHRVVAQICEGSNA